jgi:hypothetical protein
LLSAWLRSLSLLVRVQLFVHHKKLQPFELKLDQTQY